MNTKVKTDWNPETYARFRGFRLRPALDLLAQVPELPNGDVVDLGCGNGPVGAALSQRFPTHKIIGVDSSPAMLDAARATESYDGLVPADAQIWEPEAGVALIFSNALCHWLPDHETLFKRLVGFLAPGGVLAVQMPRQYAAPSHALLRDQAVQMFPDRFDFTAWKAPVASPEIYAQMLAPFGTVSVWETTYIQTLASVEMGHPVRAFTQSTAMRPFLEKLNEVDARAFTAAYDAALEAPYPTENDGSVLFAFQRVFFTVTLPL